MRSQNLNGQWQLRQEALAAIGLDGLKAVNETKAGWIPATVPGEVHLDLMAAGVMEEPFFSTNAPACRWVEDRSWWFRTRFTVDPAVAAEQVKELVCEGLDHYAQVFLNGQLIGEARNSFVRRLSKSITNSRKARTNWWPLRDSDSPPEAFLFRGVIR